MSDLMERVSLKRGFLREKFKTVDITDSGCWSWTGKIKKSRGHYGQVMLYCNHLSNPRKTFAAHRVSYAYFNGEDPGPMLVMHTCDNPRCVNPDHLKLGTHSDNMRDMADKGRSTIGEKNPRCKLTEGVVEEVVGHIKMGRTNKEIAESLPVSHSQVSLIRLGKSWKPFTEALGYDPEEHRVFTRRSA